MFCDFSTSGTLDLGAGLLAPAARDKCGGVHSGEGAGPRGRGEGGGKKGEKIPKARKAGREAGHGLETAAICSFALGLRSGRCSRARLPSPPPRPVPSATRALPWPADPASPGPRGPAGGRDAAAER